MPKAAKDKPAPKAKAGKVAKEKPAKKAKAKKDPNAPKKPCGAYMFFSKDMRGSLKEKHPEWGVTDIGKKLGEMWKALNEGEKKKYYEEAEADKKRYQKEDEAYKKKKPAADEDDEEEEDDEEDDE